MAVLGYNGGYIDHCDSRIANMLKRQYCDFNGIRLCLVADPRTFKLSTNLSSAIKYEPML